MHGIIFQQLNQFVVKNYGTQQWNNLLTAANLSGRSYLPTQIYPDAEAVALVTKASEATSLPVPKILEAFGEFIAPSLVKIYAHSIKPEWTLLDLLEHTENTMHKAVRFADKAATPPKLLCERKAKNKVVIVYSSERKMVEVGIGIIKALAKLRNEKIDIARTDTGNSTRLEITAL